MSKDQFESVWDAIADTSAEAQILKLRSVLMIGLRDHIAKSGLNQSSAGAMLGLTRPAMSDLMRGKISKFTLESLVAIASAARLQIEIQIRETA